MNSWFAFIITFSLYSLFVSVFGFEKKCGTINQGPVIGILTQEYHGDFKEYKNNRSYIAASYVKFVESAGGRVVPLLLDQDIKYYTDIMSNLSGVLLPGGGENIDKRYLTCLYFNRDFQLILRTTFE